LTLAASVASANIVKHACLDLPVRGLTLEFSTHPDRQAPRLFHGGRGFDRPSGKGAPAAPAGGRRQGPHMIGQAMDLHPHREDAGGIPYTLLIKQREG